MSVKDFLWDNEVVELKELHKKCVVKRFADRVKAMLLLNDGYSFAEVAKILIIDDDTVRNWHRIFDGEGISGLQRDLYKGGTSKVDGDQLDALAVHLEENLFLTAKAVCHWVKSEWGVEYTKSGMTGLLHGIGFSYEKPTVTPGGAPEEEVQRAFAAQIVETIENKGPDDHAYFADGVHPRLDLIASDSIR